MTIREALAPLGIRVEPLPYGGTARTYITYALVSIDDALAADGLPEESNVYYSVDLFTDEAYRPVIAQLKRLLIASGYAIESLGPEIYEPDTRLTHIPLVCSILEADDGEI